MSYEDKIVSVKKLVQEHNDSISKESGKPGQINIEAFLDCIKAIGGTSEDRLKSFSYEDILQCLPTFNSGGIGIKPTIIAKEIAKIFRGKAENDAEILEPSGLKIKVKDMPIKELISRFNPEDMTNSVGKRLAEIVKNEPFIVYEKDRVIDVATTIKLLEEIVQGYPGRSDINVDGKIKKVYRMNDLPNNFVDENPFFPGKPLRKDGTCDFSGRSWKDVDADTKKLIYLALKTGEVFSTLPVINSTLDLIEGDVNHFNKLSKYFRKAAIQFQELEAIGALPQLRVVLKSPSIFSQGTKVEFNKGKNL